MKYMLVMACVLASACAGPDRPPLTKTQVRAEWKRMSCFMDAGALLKPCLSEDKKCCAIVAENRW